MYTKQLYMYGQILDAWCAFCGRFIPITIHKHTCQYARSSKPSWPTCTFVDPAELKQHASCSWQLSNSLSTDIGKQMPNACDCLIFKWRLLEARMPSGRFVGYLNLTLLFGREDCFYFLMISVEVLTLSNKKRHSDRLWWQIALIED